MSTLFDYIQWRGDLDFKQSPLNPVDHLILSQISYLPFDGIVSGPEAKEGISLHLALEKLLDRLPSSESELVMLLGFKEIPEFIKTLVSSNRFRNCQIVGFVNKVDADKEVQFSALCLYLGDGSCSVVFRGTDATFVGWKEDFNMTFREIIPAQQEAVKYLDNIASHVSGNLQLAGHSKGGNLAIYAAAFCSDKVKKRITNIYSYDAPGFHEKIIASDGFDSIKDRVRSFIPQSSIVGMMLEHGCDYQVVKSSGTGLMQHFLFTWEVSYNDLVYVDKVTLSSRFVDKTIREWIGSLDNLQREEFVETVYKILLSSEVKSVQEMEQSWLLTLGRILKSMGNIDDLTRKKTLKTIADLFRSAGRNLETLFKRH